MENKENKNIDNEIFMKIKNAGVDISKRSVVRGIRNFDMHTDLTTLERCEKVMDDGEYLTRFLEYLLVERIKSDVNNTSKINDRILNYKATILAMEENVKDIANKAEVFSISVRNMQLELA